MRICPHCGEEVQDGDVIFHRCAPSTEIGKPIAEQEFEFIEFLWEGFKYSFLSRQFYMILSNFFPSRFNDEREFDSVKSWLYNSTSITILIWLLTLLAHEFVEDELGFIFGLVVLVSPPFFVYFAWRLMFKGQDEYAIALSVLGILILVPPVLLFLVFMMYCC